MRDWNIRSDLAPTLCRNKRRRTTPLYPFETGHLQPGEAFQLLDVSDRVKAYRYAKIWAVSHPSFQFRTITLEDGTAWFVRLPDTH